MNKIFSELKNFILRPGHLFKKTNLPIRKMYYFLSMYLHPRTYFSRKIKLKKSDVQINDELGFLKIENFHDLKIDLNLIERLKKKININDKQPIYNLMRDEDFEVDSDVFKFVTSKKIVQVVSEYLGFIPLLTTISVWFCPNNETLDKSSQFFHLDHEDIKQVKCFYFIDDIDLDMGPTLFLDQKKSQKIINNINYKITKEKKRISDKDIKNHVEENDIEYCTGKKNTIYFLDTSKCLHAGSRKSKKSRVVLFFQFISPFSNHLDWVWQRSGILRKDSWKLKNLDDIQKKLIGLKI